MASAIFRPLDACDRMQKRWPDGRATSAIAEQFIKPNDRLSSFERLEIYNRVYWFRILDCLYDDYPGLRAILGEKKFMRLATAYLAKYPSVSFTLRNLGRRHHPCDAQSWHQDFREAPEIDDAVVGVVRLDRTNVGLGGDNIDLVVQNCEFGYAAPNGVTR